MHGFFFAWQAFWKEWQVQPEREGSSMKRTELERRERDLRKAQKKTETLQRRSKGSSIGDFIEQLSGLFRHDATEIFNTKDDIAILEVLEDMQAVIPQKKWDDVLRKAIKKTGVVEKERAYQELLELLSFEEEEDAESTEEVGV
ncbi:LB_289 family protein [Leptospira fluminis]